METKTMLDNITEDNCSVKSQRVLIENGVEYTIGEPHRKAYINSPEGRKELKKEYPECFKVLELSMWGKKPTVVPKTDDMEIE